MAPVIHKPIEKPREKEIMHVKTEERHSPERKYVIEKRVVNEAEDIEQEITRELRKSRAVRESRGVRNTLQGRQTALEVAAENAMNRGSDRVRRKRIKTIKKFCEIIGKEIQYFDENSDIIRTERVAIDEVEARFERNTSRFRAGSRGANRTEVIFSSNTLYVRGGQVDHIFRDIYEREGGLGTHVASSGNLIGNRASRRGHSSGRHIETATYVSGSNNGLVDEEAEYGRYSPGGTRMSRVSRGSGGRGYQERFVSGGMRSGSGNYRSNRFAGEGGTGKYSEYREERITKGGTTRHRDMYRDDDEI